MESTVPPPGTPAAAASPSPVIAPPESGDLPETSAPTQATEETTSVTLLEERKTSQPQTLPSSSSAVSSLSSVPLVSSAPSSSGLPSLQSPAVNPISSKQAHAQPLSHPRPLQPPRPVRPSQFPLNAASSPASAPSPSSSSSSSSNLASSSGPLQRSGMAIGVPASLQQQRAPQQSSVPFSSFGPSPPFSQAFSSLPRSSAGMLNQGPNPIAQGRPPTQTVQNSGLGAQANTLRPGGFPGNYQPRPGQPSLRSSSPSTLQSSSNQKFQPGPFRGSSLSSPGSPSPSQQPWLTSTSYRPQNRPPLTQPRPTQPPLPTSLIQQSNSGQQQSQKQQLQPPLPKVQQPVYLHQQLKSQKSAVQTGAPQPGSIPPSLSSSSGMDSDDLDDNEDDSCSTIISKRTIRNLVAQIDPSERLDPEVEDILVEVAEDFVESITAFGCSLAKHRKSTTLEAKDILLHLERNWHMTIPGFGGDEIKNYKKQLTNDIHKERLALIRKSMAAAPEAGNTKSSYVGQSSAAHGKSHAPKTPSSLIGSPKLA